MGPESYRSRRREQPMGGEQWVILILTGLIVGVLTLFLLQG